MIYVKNYQALNEYAMEGGSPFTQQLQSLIGKPATIFVDGGQSFTGILIEVLPDSVRLVTALPSAPCVWGKGTCKKHRCRFGACTAIPINHVTAVTSNFV